MLTHFQRLELKIAEKFTIVTLYNLTKSKYVTHGIFYMVGNLNIYKLACHNIRPELNNPNILVF